MKERTTGRIFNGSLYVLIPAAFKKHVLKVKKTPIKLTIDGEEGSGRVTLEVEK